MFCPECGKNISDDAKFCSYCGSPIEQVVTSIVDDTICQKCGTKLIPVTSFDKNFLKNICPICNEDLLNNKCPVCHKEIKFAGAKRCSYCCCSWDGTKIDIKGTISKSTQNSNEITCPKCNSNQLTANKKGFGVGKALVGGVLLGGVGLLGGFVGSGRVKITCLKCGYTWTAGK